MYGKIIDGKLEYAPLNYKTARGNVILNFGKNVDLMLHYGYKPIKKQIPDYDCTTETIYQSEIIVNINDITIVYKVATKAESFQSSLCRQLNELEQSTANLKAQQFDMLTILTEEANK